ncbi:hypothetical protein B5X24_HaOG205877 [Helicoverpa armigera]|nr:hypothetical protein B5X24_HaOG205877 [Helicoverpa armigera]
MKIAVAIVFVVALCSHVCEVTSAPSNSPAVSGYGPAPAPEKHLSERIREGVGKAVHAAMVVKTVAHGLHSIREHKEQHDSGASAGHSSGHSPRVVKQTGTNFLVLH